MNSKNTNVRILLGVVVIATVLTLGGCGNDTDTARIADSYGASGKTALVSRLGEYSGYSAPSHDGYDRASIYIKVRDGTLLASRDRLRRWARRE